MLAPDRQARFQIVRLAWRVDSRQHYRVSGHQIQLFTIGHSTRPIEEFLAILIAHEVAVLVDVRSYPGSRRYPHFNRDSLSQSLEAAGIEYQHHAALGGRRRARPDSRNDALVNPAFRGYADYMESEQFQAGIDRLLQIASVKTTSIMCAEALWWRCHRSMISDYLKATRGVTVTHILNETRTEPHRYSAAAMVVAGELSYRGLFK